MAQNPHIIDLRRSYLPMDPNAFPPTMHATEGEDTPETRVPVIPYDGFNFMPTPQGYASFFGTNTTLGINALTGNVDEEFVIQKPDFVNLAVAFKDDGIWTKDLASGGAWTQVVVLTVPPGGTHKNWSKCVIDQTIYAYRQGEASVWKANAANSYVFTAFVPTFLNMSGQLGIFKAGSRLGFWDSLNSISWSSLDNTQDITPSISTLAGNTIFQDIVGKIITVLQHGTGFIVYCSRSIVHVTRTVDSPMLFSGRAIFNNNGISYRNEVCFGDPDTHHFVMTTTGFCEITNGQPQFIAPEASRYFKEQRDPFALQFINGKFITLSFINPEYNIGRVIFNIQDIPEQIYQWAEANSRISNLNTTSSNEEITNALRTANANWDQVRLNRLFGYTGYLQASAGQVPIWQDHLVSSIPLADLAVFKNYADTYRAEQYFFDTGFTNGGVPRVTTGTEFFIPTKTPDLVSGFDTTLQLEPNQRNFFSKQDVIFYYEGRFYEAWLEAIKIKAELIIKKTPGTAYVDQKTVLPDPTTLTFGTYIDLSFYSESNKYYGVAAKSAWLQRSLTRGKTIKIKETRKFDGEYEILNWVARSDNGIFVITPSLVYPTAYDSYATLMTNCPAISVSWLNSVLPIIYGGAYAGEFAVWPSVLFPDEEFGYDSHGNTVPRSMRFHFDIYTPGFPSPTTFFIDFIPSELTSQTSVVNAAGGATNTSNLRRFREVYAELDIEQTFEVIEEGPAYNTCVHKELGYTSIIGHGHYTSFGNFVQDDSTTEAPDYTDICTLSPAPSTQPIFRNAAGGNVINEFNLDYPAVNGSPFYGHGSVTINGVNYNYPEGSLPFASAFSIPIPGSTILLQPGSIEPLYPTYEGAFVFDTHLRKWGKLKAQFKNLLDVYPINTMAGEGFFPYESFLPKLGCRIADGTIKIFDEFPVSSEICFGKVGFYRKGFTDLEEVLVQHRMHQSGILRIEPSVDGRSVDNTQITEIPYSQMATVQQGFNLSAKWYNIVLTGFFDLIGLEARGYRAGKR